MRVLGLLCTLAISSCQDIVIQEGTYPREIALTLLHGDKASNPKFSKKVLFNCLSTDVFDGDSFKAFCRLEVEGADFSLPPQYHVYFQIMHGLVSLGDVDFAKNTSGDGWQWTLFLPKYWRFDSVVMVMDDFTDTHTVQTSLSNGHFF